MQRLTPTSSLGYLPRPGNNPIENNNGPLFIRAESAPPSLPGTQVVSLAMNNPYKAAVAGYDPTSPPYVATSPVYSAVTLPSYVPSVGDSETGNSPIYTPVSPRC
ncbi:hypothetical protein M231_02318 [Tremella mesenterica]|uniref:Uncharacterized protein n=1 Tax=Tremella mesenterica TaxID=5217 RepID=A0A4Q1BR87_TREME|nr:hypothetical protein M231_02318 [Tremella mesenterica]